MGGSHHASIVSSGAVMTFATIEAAEYCEVRVRVRVRGRVWVGARVRIKREGSGLEWGFGVGFTVRARSGVGPIVRDAS